LKAQGKSTAALEAAAAAAAAAAEEGEEAEEDEGAANGGVLPEDLQVCASPFTGRDCRYTTRYGACIEVYNFHRTVC
jgi:hypothetical protein